MKIKKILLTTFTILISITLTACNLGLTADTSYQSPSEYEATRIEMIQTVKDSVVVVETSNDYGSGIIFNSKIVNQTTGLKEYAVLTVYDNVDFVNTLDMNVILENTQTFPVTNAVGDETYGVAVVYFQTTLNLSVYDIPQLAGTVVGVTQGEDVYAMGTPYQYYLFNYVSQGVIGVTSHDYGDIENLLFVHSSETNPGMEGGPVFNLSGQIVGLQLTKLYMTDSSVDGVPVEGINFAININMVKDIILGFDEDFTSTSAANETLLSVTDSNYNEIAKQMIADVTPAVVSVIGSGGLGSGIIYQKETLESGLFRYYILTNNHVIDLNTEVRIRLESETHEVAVVDYQVNESYDIAVLRVETDQELPVKDIPPITQNKYIDIVEGQDVYAIGSPLSVDYHNYVTQGIVSRINYAYKGIYQLGIVHEAEINPGNSGGPLFNLNGEVIGVNVAKVVSVNDDSGSVIAEGINYSLNVNVLSQAINNFTEEGWVQAERSPKLGVTVVDYNANFEIFPSNILMGVLVTGFDYTRASYLQLEVYDLIVSIDGAAVRVIDDLVAGLDGKDFGDTLTLGIKRVDSEGNVTSFTVDIKLS